MPISFFNTRKWVLWVVLLLLFSTGLAVRIYDLTDLPLDFHPTRQLHSALVARGMYYQAQENAPSWQREVAIRQWKLEGVIEPPFMEWLASRSYLLAGGEYLWIPRLFSIFFWMAGGFGLFFLARSLVSPDGAVIALAFYWLLPYGVIASRSFQPDPLMTALIIWALWALYRWQGSDSWMAAIWAGLLGGAAILCKSVAVFFVVPAFVAAVIPALGLAGALRSKQVWLAAFLSALPYAIYHVYGVFFAGYLSEQFSQRFFPEMWLQPGFYLQWSRKINQAVGLHWFLPALLGLFMPRQQRVRLFLVALWGGYFLYGMTLPHHTSTHDYYQLPLIPLVALGLAAGASVLFGNLRGPRWLQKVLVLCVFILGAGYYAWDARTILKSKDYRPEALAWQAVGNFTGHESNIIALTPDYGARLAYWGWVTPNNWPTLGDMRFQGLPVDDAGIEALFDQKAAGRDYFITGLPDELERQPALKRILSGFHVVDEQNGILVFDLKAPIN